MKPHIAREHEFEAEHGLPERLPAQERLLWQGGPRWQVLARTVFHVNKVAVYFGVLALWRLAVMWPEVTSLADAWRAVAWVVLPGTLALGLLVLLAWLTVRTTVYTLTSKRVVMRIGIVLTVAYNLPLKRIDAADVHDAGAGCQDIALQIEQGTRIAWLHLWPHVRPWQVRRPQPMLRALPDGTRVAGLLSAAWAEARGELVRPALTPSRSSEVRLPGLSSPAVAGGAD
jgi:hypothetical protein